YDRRGSTGARRARRPAPRRTPAPRRASRARASAQAASAARARSADAADDRTGPRSWPARDDHLDVAIIDRPFQQLRIARVVSVAGLELAERIRLKTVGLDIDDRRRDRQEHCAGG